ncbi:MAG TPA: Gfo/Idh/MocA family oxidoreductase [Candidatus Baltobacteraceae bacterium]|jgi:predicted dehydrogenase|nr:Gfo/Idh/MocA family oxidoreductase [Candidatus Baltobacteraceae bacterium]
MTPEPRRINVAVVGLGFMGMTHLRAYLAGQSARVAAVCGVSRLPVNGVLQGVRGNIGANSEDIQLDPRVKVFRKFEELLADGEVELVDLCTPTPAHPEQCIAALQAGKHVLCEKPLARTSAAAREILRVAESSPGILMPAMCMRFWPGWSWLKEVVQKEPYGRILAARFRRVSEMPGWSKQDIYGGAIDLGGALFDLHIHDTDFINFLFGRPAAVFSSGVINSAGTVDHVVTQYIYPGGPAVHAEGNWLLTRGFNMAFTIHCQRATLDFDLGRGADAMQIAEQRQPARSIHYDQPDGYVGEIRYMLDCIAQRRQPEIVDASSAVTALEICEAEEKSIRTGAPVPI